MKRQQVFNRYFRTMANKADLSSRQEAIVEFAFDLALTDMEDACVAAHEAVENAGTKTAADVHALEARMQEQDGELLRLTTLEDRLTQWLSSRGVMLANHGDDLYAAIKGNMMALDGQLYEMQTSVAFLTNERNRLKRPLADLENTIEAVREVEQLRPWPPSVTNGNGGTLTVHTDDLVTHHNGHNGATMPVVAKPTRIDFAGTNEELREQVFAAMRLFHKQNGRAPSHNDWKAAGPAAQLPSANTIENRLGMRWTAIATAAGLEPNAKFNARSEVKAENAEATFRSED